MILAERYQVVRPLAQGGFGKTFLACDRYLPGNPHCVIKQFRPLNLADSQLPTAQRLFDLEAKTLYQLGTHPQIPTLLAHFEKDGEFYLVQEYIAGVSLADELTQPSIPNERALASRQDYAYQLLHSLLTALTFVHQRSVIHRDIKPGNLIRREGSSQLAVIDFGAVKTIGAQSSASASALTIAIGSPGYIAPEQQAGRPCFASDLYASGVVALYALTGKAPQQQPTDPETGCLQLPSDGLASEPSFIQFIQQLIKFNPADRFPHAAAALDVLQSLNLTSASVALPPTAFPISSPPFPETILPDEPFPTTSLSDPKTASLTSAPAKTFVPTQQNILSPTESRNRQALLSKVDRFWIQGVLEHSLHGQVLLTLGLEEKQQALSLPWNISYSQADQPPQPLDAGVQVYDIFAQQGEGRSLLILGEPGAGKTTTLLTLARDLLKNAQPGQRIPAIFNLSSWTGGSIAEWLIGELNSKYQIPKAIGEAWVAGQQLLLLLDGLDEVRGDRQNDCAIALNTFHQNYGPELVVCCRIKDYEALDQQLGFQRALMVRSLTDEQIWQYLAQADSGLTGLRSLLERSAATAVAVKGTSESDQTLFDLARSPLILNIMALTYQGLSASEIPALTQGESYTQQLFSAYISRMFQRRDIDSPYSQKQTLRWLHELAKTLTQTSQTVFLIERMQVPWWLTAAWQRYSYVGLLFLAYLVIATSIGWQVVSHRSLPLAIAIGAVMCARIFGIYRIVPAETLRWSWKKARTSFLLGLTLGPMIGWALKVGFVYIFSPGYCVNIPGCLLEISLIGLLFGLVLGIDYAIIRGLSGTRIATITKPNQGIRQSGKNAILFAVVATIAPALTSLIFANSTSTQFWAIAGLSFGLALGGGEACLKHGILRFVLFCQGRTPWHYPRFLDYAAQRILLQKVGGGYIFIHRLLLEHFADMKPQK
ncbi:MAG: protein kinase [Cyanobacteria bacterium J06573_11]